MLRDRKQRVGSRSQEVATVVSRAVPRMKSQNRGIPLLRLADSSRPLLGNLGWERPFPKPLSRERGGLWVGPLPPGRRLTSVMSYSEELVQLSCVRGFLITGYIFGHERNWSVPVWWVNCYLSYIPMWLPSPACSPASHTTTSSCHPGLGRGP